MNGPGFDSSLVFPTIIDLRAAHRQLLRQQQQGAVDSKVVEDFVDRARLTGVKLYRDADRELAQSVLDYWITALYRSRVEIEEATLAPFDETHARALTEQSPYLGLAPFTENDSARFFGRAAMLRALQTRIESDRLLILIGQSGTGKSSLVRGGLVPKLRRGALPGSETWRYLDAIVPGSQPLTSLARLLRPRDTVLPDGWLERETRKLLDSPRRLHEILTQPDGEPAFLIVDQFEELFTLCSDVRERQAFTANLVYLTTAPGPPHKVVLTVRSDYQRHLSHLPNLDPKGERRVTIGPLNDSELREVIERPAEMAGLLFEPGLVDKIIDDVRGEPAALPLLQFTLWKLWEKRNSRNHLTTAEYDRLHGALFALGTVASEVYDKLAPQAQNCARRIFLRIVRTSSAPDSGGERVSFEIMSRRVRKSDVVAGEVDEEAEAVLQKLIAAGLLRETQGESAADVQIEVAHEALIRNWGLLRSWIDQEPLLIRKRDQLEALAQTWHDRGRRDAFLDHVRLKDAKEWLVDAEARAFTISDVVRDYIRASETEQERLKDEERHRRRVFRVLTAGFVVVLFLTLFTAWMKERADNATRTSEAKRKQAELLKSIAEKEAQNAEARFDAFKLKNTNEQIAQLSLEAQELRATNARLMEENAGLQAALGPASNAQTPVVIENRVLLETQAKLKGLERELKGAVTELEKRATVIASLDEDKTQLRDEVARLERRLAAAVASPAVPPVLTGEPLRVLDLVSSLWPGAVPAAIGCFLKDDDGSHYLLTTASALQGDPGDYVVRHSGGTTQRVGIIWWQDREMDAAVALLFPGIRTDEKLPALSPQDKPKGIRGTTWFDTVGDTLRVVSRRNVVEVTLTAKEPVMQISYTGNALDHGAPVINGPRSLVGVVASETPEGAKLIPMRPLLARTGLRLDTD